MRIVFIEQYMVISRSCLHCAYFTYELWLNLALGRARVCHKGKVGLCRLPVIRVLASNDMAGYVKGIQCLSKQASKTRCGLLKIHNSSQ